MAQLNDASWPRVDVAVREVVVVVVEVGQSPRNNSSLFVVAPGMQVPALLSVLSDLLQPQLPMQSLPHLMVKQWSVVGVDVVTVDVVVVIVAVVVVGQSPKVISSFFVIAPATQVPALLPVVSALLQPHVPMQSFPHLMLRQGDNVVVVVVVLVAVVVVMVVVVVGQSPNAISSRFVVAPAIQVPVLPPVISLLLQPQLPMQSLPHLMVIHWSVVGVDVVAVVVLAVAEVAVVVVVGQSPNASSSFFVIAPATQVPALLPVVSDLLQPHFPVHSFPHLMLRHGNIPVNGVAVVMDVDDEGTATVVSGNPVDSNDPAEPDALDDPEPDRSNVHTASTSLQQSLFT